MTNPTDGPHTTTTSPKTNHAEKACTSPWPLGLYGGLLVECDRQAKHTGAHGSQSSSVTWTGKPIATEQPMVDRLIAVRLDLTQDVTP